MWKTNNTRIGGWVILLGGAVTGDAAVGAAAVSAGDTVGVGGGSVFS